MENNHSIQTRLEYSNGRTLSSFTGHPDIEIAGLSNVRGQNNAWSPIHLLVSAVESCFLLTLSSLADKMHMEVKNYTSETSANLLSSDEKHYEVTDITIKPKIIMAKEEDNKRIPQLVKMAEEYCPVANSLKERINIVI